MDFQSAMTQRSLRNVKAELEFLADTHVITSQQLSSILTQLPLSDLEPSHTSATTNSMSTLSLNNTTAATTPASHNAVTTANGYPNEKAHGYGTSPAPQESAPPAYNPGPPLAAPLTHATALYAYNATDAGDLNLQPNDRIAVTEYMNAEWWKGRNERTGAEGIFPRSYVRVEEAKGHNAPAPSNYGNMPLDVASGAQAQPDGGPADGKNSKLQEGGKKFGKKLGNAAIFGAGATIGSNIVNGIF